MVLLPQVDQHSSKIEVVISNNGSTDNTHDIINKYVRNFHGINFVINHNDSNLGFFGNFSKVKELSTGEFIWILSDDDHVDARFLSFLIYILQSNMEIGVFFLQDWIFNNKILKVDYYSTHDLFIKFSYKLTLISSIIFKNEKEHDIIITKQYYGSNFIGFLYLINIASKSEKSISISGNSINVGRDIPKGYNWFQAFVIDMNKALAFMQKQGFKEITIKRLETQVFKKLIIHRYKFLKAFKKLDGGLDFWEIDKVNELIFKYYITSFYRLLYFLPAYISPAILLKIRFNSEKYLRKFYRLLRNFFVI
jgi:glycosyltransferase involved in cell wall biosynthesis